MSYNPKCSICPFEKRDRLCSSGEKFIKDCPTKQFQEYREEIKKEYLNPQIDRIYKISSDIKGPGKTRIEETLYVAEKMGYQKIGIAFCSGLKKEAEIIQNLFEAKGFVVNSVICSCGNLKKSDFIENTEDKNNKSFCNPYLQAAALNKAETEWNIVVGLCVGHDSIFMKYSNAMCTVFAVKDKVAAHNPLGPVYTLDTYYNFLKK
ncbi:MAG: DUF1847 domain-containing protein [Desulfobacteraceae bacterium]|nr:DUF1847 domain-containing protein [Desulfobacteraceae bacterium]MCB9494717.1 DUF1847 domain-containing protein [Desulfobacteraceae bacterium]